MAKFSSQQEFIDFVAPSAQESYKKYGVYASVTIAQACWESGWGNSNQPVVNKDNNYFGITYDGGHDPGISISKGSSATDGGPVNYASYKSPKDSILDHGYFLKNNSRYPNGGVFANNITPQEQIKKIMDCGYAESRYDTQAVNIMDQFSLYKYDTGEYVGTGNSSSSSEEKKDPLAVNYDAVTEREYNKSMSYFGSSVQQATKADLNTLKDKTLNKYAEDRHFSDAPPSYYDYVNYSHRSLAYQLADESNPVPLVNGTFDLSPLTASMASLDRDDNSNDVYEYGDLNRVFRLGDCYFIIPPEFITVSTKSSSKEIQGLRQSSATQEKNGYSRKEIQISLVLNGMNQINGYEVESPMEYKYAVDGLRTLLSQFKYTPFVPVENTVINLIHGVHNVALRNINVETISGFPEALQITISMQEFNATPYTRSPNEILTDAIDWDLYRYYVQQSLRDRDEVKFPNQFKKISTPSLTSEFQFSILTQQALDSAYEDNVIETKDDNGNVIYKQTEYEKENGSIGDYNLYVNIFDPINYEPLINSNDDISLTYMSFSMGNIMPLIQLSAHDSPTMQYLGCTNARFTFGFETTDTNVAALFNQLNDQNQDLVRSNRFKNGIGFIKIDNELVQLTGTKFVLLEDVAVSTMPGFPGTYSITCVCSNYDSAQKENEKLIAMRPFENNRKGTREDLISMQSEGMSNKILQDSTIQKRFQTLEMYPDLDLPTLSELDEAINKIRVFRSKHNLTEQMLFDKYPRHMCVIPGSTKEQMYEGYADPDFYVMCLNTPSDVQMGNETSQAVSNLYNGKSVSNAVYDSSNSKFGSNIKKVTSISDQLQNIDSPLDLYYRPTFKPDIVTEPNYVPGYEPGILDRVHKGLLEFIGTDEATSEQGGVTNEDGTITKGTSVEGSSVLAPSTINKKTGNVFVDLLCDRADAGCGYIFGAWGERLGTKNEANGKWFDKQVFDCSGLVSWGLNVVGLMKGRTNNTGFDGMGTRIPFTSLKAGDLLVRTGGTGGGHIAVYIGPNQIVESQQQATGVVYSPFTQSRFNYAVRLTELDKYNKSYLENNPNIYGKKSSSKVEAAYNPVANYLANDASESAKLGILSESTYGSMANMWDEQILKASTESGLDPNFIKAVMIMESNGDKDKIIGKSTGLMQIFVSKEINPDVTRAEMLEPQKNLTYGSQMLVKLGSKYNLDLDKTLICYIAGSNYVGTDPSMINIKTGTVRNSIDKVLEIYKACISGGGNPGSQNVPSINGQKVIGDGTDEEDYGDGVNVNERLGEDASKFKNPNAGQIHGNKISNIDIMQFGLDFIEQVATYKDNKYNFSTSTVHKDIKLANNSEHIIEYMYIDHKQYSMKGTLCRAFPSYLLVFLDEQADWVDRKKLWTNYYVSRSAIDINIHEAYDTPINTATATLTNFYSNLTHLKVGKSIKNLAFDDDDYIRRFMYWSTGTILDEEISDKMIGYKNEMYDDIKLEEGARVHIRLGYGSNPARYPTSFNGTIAQIDTGETVTFIAQSDGTELVNQPLTDKSEDTNKDLDLGVEVSNIVSNMMVSRQSNFLYTFSKGFFKYKSKYGIEHFGIHMNTGSELSIGSVAKTGLNTLLDPVYSLSSSIDNSMNYKQYDIVKNIYTGTYNGVPFCKDPYNPFDGEYNFRFFCAGKTVWDVLKMCEKAVPEFVAYPRYFNFESRLFYGLPTWLCKYKYNNDGDYLYEHAKSFAQVHQIDSLDSIIDNNIKLDSRNLYTNMIGIYTLGGDLSSTPVIMSDKNIDWSKQKTKTVDTTSVQDFAWVPGFVDKLLSWTGAYDNGKQLAINVCISELMDSWKNSYSGSLLILGQPEISAHDYMFLNDDFIKMTGMCTVREVVHSMSISSGFITTIVPGLIANNTLKQSGMTNVMMGLSQYGRLASNVATLTLISANMYSATARTVTAIKFAQVANKAKKVGNFLNGPGKAAFSFVKTLKIVTKGVDYLKEVKTIATIGSKLKSLKNILTIGSTIVKGISLTFPPALIASIALDVVLNIFFTWLYDMFAYNNTICLNPLITKTSDDQITPFVGNKTGQKTLLPNFAQYADID